MPSAARTALWAPSQPTRKRPCTVVPPAGPPVVTVTPSAPARRPRLLTSCPRSGSTPRARSAASSTASVALCGTISTNG